MSIGQDTRPRRNPGASIFRVFALIAVWAPVTVSAKDLYVAPDGSDSVSYRSNDIDHPWRTIGHGVYNLGAGDTLYIRQGTYVPDYTIYARNDSTRIEYGGNPRERVRSESGTAANPVRITSYPGEHVVIDCRNVTIWLDLDEKDYWEVSNLEFINVQVAVQLGWDSHARYNTFRNNRIVMNRGGDNGAALKLHASRSEYNVIEGNEIIGPGTGHEIDNNTSTIYFRLIKNIKILNNRLSNAPMAIYAKHANPGPAGEVDIEIAYNYITDTSRNAIQLNTNFAHIHDNIFGPNNEGIRVAEANGGSGGDYNVFEHNTFFETWLHTSGDSDGENNIEPGGYGNLMRNNLFMLPVYLQTESTELPHGTFMDYNMHADRVAVEEFGVPYTLSRWRKHSGGSHNSIDAKPIFVGGDEPVKIEDYRLAPDSPGVHAASDGEDIGARIDRFERLKPGLAQAGATDPRARD
jgi:hypothetical protein